MNDGLVVVGDGGREQRDAGVLPGVGTVFVSADTRDGAMTARFDRRSSVCLEGTEFALSDRPQHFGTSSGGRTVPIRLAQTATTCRRPPLMSMLPHPHP